MRRTLLIVCAWTVLSTSTWRSANAQATLFRDPLQYSDTLSAPVGYNPLLDPSLSKTGRVPRRYIVRMKQVPDLEGAISRVLLKTTVMTNPPKVDGGIVMPASLAEAGAIPDNKFSAEEMQGFILDVPEGVNEEEAVQKLSTHEDVMRVVPDTWVGVAAATERLASTAEATTSLLRIGAIIPNRRPASSARPMVQQASNGSVVVAIIDTGCDVTNTDLNIAGGMDFTSDNSYGLDGNGHGTHVAGILGSRGNSHGIVGMFPNVAIYCLKVLGATGQGTMGTVVTALSWVAQNGRSKNIRVVNLSLSGETNKEVCDAISAVTKQGITVVAAAGNNGQDMSNYSPGNCGGALVVTAMTDFDGLPGGLKGVDAATGETDDSAARFSNYAARGRPSNMIAAPGTRILSYMPAYKCLDGSSACIPGTPNLAFLSGTSMAAPVVTGQVAMCYEKGSCKANSSSELSKIVRVAVTYGRSNKEFGFRGDINDPFEGKYYGNLIYGNAF